MKHSLKLQQDFNFWHLSQTERDTLINAIQFSNNGDGDTIHNLVKLISEHHFSKETVELLINQYAQKVFKKGFLSCESKMFIDPMTATHHLHRGVWLEKKDYDFDVETNHTLTIED